MKNNYHVIDGKAYIHLSSGEQAIVDEQDFLLVDSYPGTWHAVRRRSNVYAAINVGYGRGNTTLRYMHRLVAMPRKGMHVDHIDRNGLNNARANLRELTAAQNAQNVDRARSNSSTGILGVSLHGPTGKWRGRVAVDGKTHHLGVFDAIEDAEAAVIEARRRLHPYSPHPETLLRKDV